MTYYISFFRASPLFFFNAPATSEIYTLSLHDALPILCGGRVVHPDDCLRERVVPDQRRRLLDVQQVVQRQEEGRVLDRKSTRLNSSHPSISYAVFCLKKKNKKMQARINCEFYNPHSGN